MRSFSSKNVQKKKIFIVVTVIAIIGIFASVGVTSSIKTKAEEQVREDLRIKNEKTEELKQKINSIYEEEDNVIESTINDTVKDSKDYGVYYEDLTTNKKITYNEDKQFTAASTIKVALVLDAADMIREGTLKEDEQLIYTSNEYEGGTGILQDTVVPGVTKLDVETLMKLAITHSDNIATQMLKKRCEDLDTYVTRTTKIPRKTGGNYLTAQQQGILLKKLYDNSDNNPVYNKILGYMKNTIFHDRLDKYVPYELVAHKIGNNEGFTHDTGIIYTERPYSLSVYTESVGTESMAKLSENIYNLKIENDNKIKEMKENYKNEYGVEI